MAYQVTAIVKRCESANESHHLGHYVKLLQLTLKKIKFVMKYLI